MSSGAGNRTYAAFTDLVLHTCRRLSACTYRQGGMSSHDKYITWEEIKLLTFTRAIAASWMVALLDLMTRVQLNILGRHLYLQSNVLDTRSES